MPYNNQKYSFIIPQKYREYFILNVEELKK